MAGLRGNNPFEEAPPCLLQVLLSKSPVGPSRGKAVVQGTGYMHLDNMLEGYKIYALVALSISVGITPQP